ncbi:hypothetical protein [Haloferax denitrificans]|uniref:DUF8108 domain-containing protein n=1 Tax=Haloferax denitrificans ATCC 35960 TaxID=662478 RepID=M0IXH3_9EURY|nr:hypothetical protein [Haloferax denitrificans]EMA01537.1 hypothetical protein C438_14301 [Haloferax denitrificans ATCC 35960]
MPHPTLLSSTLRRLTVAVSLITSTLFAALAAAILFPQSAIWTWALLFFFPIFWLHCYVPGYVSYSPTSFGRVREVVTSPGSVRECVVCGEADDRGVVREFSTQFVVAGVPLATTDSGENEYCAGCHAVEFSPTDEAARGETEVAESEDDSGESAELND